MGFPKNVTNPEIQFTYQPKGGPKKLIYVPPTKKYKEFLPTVVRTYVNKEFEE